MKALYFFLICAGLFFVSYSANAQDADTLQVRFDNLVESSETYQQFKVIPQTKLNAFWKEVSDSLKKKEATIDNLEEEVSALKEQVSDLSEELATVKEELVKSQELTDTISFLGIPLSEASYHLIVWGIISVLAGLGIFSYFLFIRSNTGTSRAKRELIQLTQEFEDHKNQAREKQVKLKRELQTAINQLNEKR